MFDELTCRRLGAEEGAVEVDADHRAPSVGRQIEARRGDARAVIVDEHVDAPEMLDRGFDHRVALVGLAHLDGGELAGAAGLTDVVAHLGEIFHVAARDQHLGAARAEFLCDRFSDTGAAAGYDGHFAFDAEDIFGICHDAPVLLIASDDRKQSLAEAREDFIERLFPGDAPGGGANLPAALAQMARARRDLEPQMWRGARFEIAADAMLP